MTNKRQKHVHFISWHLVNSLHIWQNLHFIRKYNHIRQIYWKTMYFLLCRLVLRTLFNMTVPINKNDVDPLIFPTKSYYIESMLFLINYCFRRMYNIQSVICVIQLLSLKPPFFRCLSVLFLYTIQILKISHKCIMNADKEQRNYQIRENQL